MIRLVMRWGIGAVAIVACCASGAAVSALLRPTARAVTAESVAESAAEAPEPEKKEEVASETSVSEPAQLDRLLLDGRYVEVLEAVETLREKTEGAARDALDYRQSLCWEVLGRDGALDGYTALVARCPDAPAGIAAATGQARLWLRQGKAEKARKLLAALQLRTGRPPLRGLPIQADITNLLALSMAREVYSAEPPGLLNLAVAHPTAEVTVAPMVAMVKWDAAAPSGDAPAVPTAVQKPGPKPEAWTVSAAGRQMVIADFLNEIAEKGGLQIDWNPEARKLAAGRTLAISLEQVPLTEVLRAAAGTTDLGWEITDNRLKLTTLPPLPARQAQARKAMVEATTTYPEHPLAPAINVELGNLDMTSGRLREAAGWYDRLLRDRPRSTAATETYFNLGLARGRLGERGLARDAFYRVVDRGPTKPLASIAYLYIGRLYLEDANPALATRALRRVQSAGGNLLSQTCAGLLLSAAELLDDNPRAAHAAIVEVRRGIGEEPFVRTAALLDALSRFRATVEPARRERASGDLLAALLAYREDSLLGSPGLVLAGQGYRDLDLGDEMATLYRKAIPGVGSALAMSMKADLAEHLMASGKKGAAPLLREVAAAPGPRAVRAELRLAEMALKQKHPDECLSRCRRRRGPAHGPGLHSKG
jgi:tetratricopeptide (TPR) repeat protein